MSLGRSARLKARSTRSARSVRNGANTDARSSAAPVPVAGKAVCPAAPNLQDPPIRCHMTKPYGRGFDQVGLVATTRYPGRRRIGRRSHAKRWPFAPRRSDLPDTTHGALRPHYRPASTSETLGYGPQRSRCPASSPVLHLPSHSSHAADAAPGSGGPRGRHGRGQWRGCNAHRAERRCLAHVPVPAACDAVRPPAAPSNAPAHGPVQGTRRTAAPVMM